ncbi:hypothetical protein Vafri_9609, partial [Volvox africanus]
ALAASIVLRKPISSNAPNAPRTHTHNYPLSTPLTRCSQVNLPYTLEIKDHGPRSASYQNKPTSNRRDAPEPVPRRPGNDGLPLSANEPIPAPDTAPSPSPSPSPSQHRHGARRHRMVLLPPATAAALAAA